MTTKTLIKVSLVLCLMALTLSSKVCQKYTCANLKQKGSLMCAEEYKVKTTDLYSNYLLQEGGCTDAVNNFCPWSSTDLESGKPSVNCEPSKKQHPKSLPGFSCETENDCMSAKKCLNKICQGAKENEVCALTSDCFTGLYCAKISDTSKQCKPQVKENGTCVDQYDCINTHGCLNSKCVPYFSLANGSDVTIPQSLNKINMYCQSGFSYTNASKKHQCAALENIKTEGIQDGEKFACDTTHPCKYKDGASIITDAGGKCKCGKNAKSQMFCELGSASATWAKYIASYKNVLTKSINCHSSERFTCKSFKTNDPNTELQFRKDKINAENFPELQNAGECVKDIIFPTLNSKPIDTSKKCPKYVCASGKPDCANVAVAKKDITATINPCEKFDTQRCPTSYSSIESATKAFQVKCENVQKSAYCGEQCATDPECIYGQKKCENKICKGSNKGETCASDFDCNVGFFCDLTSKKCDAQVDAKAACTKESQCKNNLTCFNKVCTPFFSLQNGADVPKASTDTSSPKMLCVSGYLSSQLKCDEEKYASSMKPNAENMVACSYTNNELCKYTDSTNTEHTKPCVCSLSKDGASYCPKPYASAKTEYDAYYKGLADSYNNNCHTKHRFNCPSAPSNAKNSIITNKVKSVNAALFHNAETCTIEMFAGRISSSAGFLKYSVVVAVLAFISMLF